jgi:cystinosin
VDLVSRLYQIANISQWLIAAYSVLSWSASFYPQPLMNWRRRSTHGLAIDFPLLNVLGFAAYTISTACFLYSPTIRNQYAARHPRSPEPTVRFNDLAFGVHAVILVAITYSQFYSRLWGFQVSHLQRSSRPVLGIVFGSIISVIGVAVFVWIHGDSPDQNESDWAWIDVIYIFGYIKLIATFVKYIPQAWINFKRKSTKGWSIDQILFDIIGGVLSLLQLIIDASFQGDWSGITGNPLKFGLANVSIFFDLIFITQHYILYRTEPGAAAKSWDTSTDDVHQPLLPERG